jgi:ribosomal protein S18 acetylase RimI-like enzyme
MKTNIKYKIYKDYQEEEVLKLYNSVQWANYTENPNMLKAAYENSLYILGAYDNDDLVGVIRVIGDGHSIIYIQDIIVRPDYQRYGIGSKLLSSALSTYSHVYQKILLTENEEKTVKFYESVGFKADHDLGCVAFCQFKS